MFLRRASSVLVRNARVQHRCFSADLPAHEVMNMPALSPTMESGIIGQWLCKAGDAVAPGDGIAEIETDKASMTLEAMDDNVIAKMLVAEGTEVKVGQPILVLVEEGIDIAAFADFMPVAVAAPEPIPAAAAPTPAPVAAPAGRSVWWVANHMNGAMDAGELYCARVN